MSAHARFATRLQVSDGLNPSPKVGGVTVSPDSEGVRVELMRLSVCSQAVLLARWKALAFVGCGFLRCYCRYVGAI